MSTCLGIHRVCVKSGNKGTYLSVRVGEAVLMSVNEDEEGRHCVKMWE